MSRVLAVVPAAGRGSRAGLTSPKILATLDDEHTVWRVLRERLMPHVERIVLVLSPEGQRALEARPNLPRPDAVCVQAEPRGMGDAVFSASGQWEGYDAVLVVWGDQLGLSADTVKRTVECQLAQAPPAFTLPLVEASDLYVEYELDDAGRLSGVRQSREGDTVDARGKSDVGCFCLSTQGLSEAWQDYLDTGRGVGRRTGEINFLPFLSFLSVKRGWALQIVPVSDPDERRGVNTPEELEFFRRRFRASRG